MKSYLIFTMALAACVMVAGPARAQGEFKIEAGRAFSRVVPRDFVLEGNAIPTQKRNTVLVMTPSGARLVVGLLDTSGYSSHVQEKYKGMLIAEGRVSVCGNSVPVGSYGFGLAKQPGAPGGHAALFLLYNQAGQKVAECRAEWDAKIARPKPLQVKVNGGGSARLYVGRDWIELK